MGADAPATVSRQTVLEMMHAYKSTSLLKAALSLGVFDAIGEGADTVESVAQRCDAHPRAMRILVHALAAVGLVEVRDRRVELAAGVAPLLRRDSPGYVGDMVHVIASDEEWEALRRLPEAVRHGGAVVDQHAETPEYAYWEAFATHATAVARPTAGALADALAPWAATRRELRVLDVAAGHGLYGFTVARRHPGTRVVALDWANVLPIARRHAEELGVADRAEFRAGDMFTAELGGPYDLVLVTNVLHHFSEERCVQLLRRLRGVLAEDGRLAVVGFALGEQPPRHDPGPHLFSVLMLVWTAQGEVHRAAAYDRMLRAAGFARDRHMDVPDLPFKIVIAERSEA